MICAASGIALKCDILHNTPASTCDILHNTPASTCDILHNTPASRAAFLCVSSGMLLMPLALRVTTLCSESYWLQCWTVSVDVLMKNVVFVLSCFAKASLLPCVCLIAMPYYCFCSLFARLASEAAERWWSDQRLPPTVSDRSCSPTSRPGVLPTHMQWILSPSSLPFRLLRIPMMVTFPFLRT